MKNPQILRTIGRNIRLARYAMDLTQEQLAEKVDIHWKTLGYIESGKRDFGVTIMARLALALNLSGNQLLEGIQLEHVKS